MDTIPLSLFAGFGTLAGAAIGAGLVNLLEGNDFYDSAMKGLVGT